MPPKPRRKFGATQKERIFFAAMPDAATAARIHALAERLKADHKLDGNLILPEHLHVTLFHLGDWITLPEEIVARARDAAAQTTAAPFEATFRKVESFRNRTGIFPFVLTDKDAAPWRPLRTALGAALKTAGLGGAVHLDDEFKPHVTLLRDDTRLKPIAVDPISWSVRDFVLIHSLLGKTTHIHLARRELTG
jgi:2'-5' RNA ligase